MPKFEIVYFTGCPIVPLARKALRDAGISMFTETNQDKLPDTSELKGLSSPSILVDGSLIVGSRSSSQSCSVVDWGSVTAELKKSWPT